MKMSLSPVTIIMSIRRCPGVVKRVHDEMCVGIAVQTSEVVLSIIVNAMWLPCRQCPTCQ